MKPIRIIAFSLTFVVTLAVLFYTENKDYYEAGENDSFDVKVGEAFVIKLDENPSTGGKNCWLTAMKSVRLKNAAFNPNSSADGAGGVTTYTFEAVAKGTDTIRVANCPLAHDNKDCPDYNDKNTKPDNVFVINVKE